MAIGEEWLGFYENLTGGEFTTGNPELAAFTPGTSRRRDNAESSSSVSAAAQDLPSHDEHSSRSTLASSSDNFDDEVSV